MQQEQKNERHIVISMEEYLKIRRNKYDKKEKSACVYIGGRLILENTNGKY